MAGSGVETAARPEAASPIAEDAAGRGVAALPRRSFSIPSLDGMRAGAVFLVFLSHVWTRRWIPGNFGVTVFFFLSGYLITTLLRMEYERAGRISFRDFYLRRALRILPPFYLVLAIASTLTLAGLLEGSVQTRAALFQLFHLSNYYIIRDGWWAGRAPGTWVYWSLAIEEHFYLVFPLLYLVMLRRLGSVRRQVLVLVAICTGVLLWRGLLVFVLQASKDRTYMGTDTRIDSILFGCILAIWNNPALDASNISERLLKWLWLPLGVIGLLLSFAVLQPRFQETLRYTLQGLSLFPIFIVAIRYPTWGPFRILNIGLVRFLGLLSFSFYLLHPTVIFGVKQWTRWNSLSQAAAALLIALALSWGIYLMVERPAAGLRRRLSHAG